MFGLWLSFTGDRVAVLPFRNAELLLGDNVCLAFGCTGSTHQAVLFGRQSQISTHTSLCGCRNHTHNTCMNAKQWSCWQDFLQEKEGRALEMTFEINPALLLLDNIPKQVDKTIAHLR